MCVCVCVCIHSVIARDCVRESGSSRMEPSTWPLQSAEATKYEIPHDT